MKIIKRNGAEVGFDITKIIIAITKANESVEEVDRMTPVQIQRIAESVDLQCQKMNRAPTVEEIQDMVEHYIMAHGAFEVAKHYITYRYTRSLVRKSNTTDDKILSLIECNNEEAKQENSNKNPVVNSTQRDYMAGEVSRDITNRLLLPREIVEAHEEGIIHFHDTDYFAQHMHNCDLVNLEDMLQNGTVITGTLIERPHSFSTACNIATQIIAQIASNQYGGQSISLTHLAPFVDVSRRKIRETVEQEMLDVGVKPTEEQLRLAGVESVVFDRIEANPLKSTVMAGAAAAREHGCDMIVALGGGSVMDAAKAIALMASNDGDLWDYVFGGTGKEPVSYTHLTLPTIA